MVRQGAIREVLCTIYDIMNSGKLLIYMFPASWDITWMCKKILPFLKPYDRIHQEMSNFNFQWTETLCQNNLKHIPFLFIFFKG